MSQFYLSLGTNLGDRPQNLQRALELLEQSVAVTAVSALYETQPWGVLDQPPFLNICVRGATSLTPHQLLRVCQEVEQEVGRTQTFKWGPRLIDIDILFYDERVIADDALTIPHPFLAKRAFVLAPLADIAPDFVHPRTGQTVVQMLAQEYTTAVIRLPGDTFWEIS